VIARAGPTSTGRAASSGDAVGIVKAPVAVLGIRHHGPGSARSVRRALDELDPDVVVIEGAPELDAVVELAASHDMAPPVAGLVYVVDEPSRAAFYPLAVFSPEWVAMRWALAQGVPVRFADLPATVALADQPAPDAPAAGPRAVHRDPIATLAALAGYDDPEQWWEDAIEQRASTGVTMDRFDAVRDAMGQLRADDPTGERDARREAAMRKVLRDEAAAGRRQIAFVCGAYHAPAVHPDRWPPQSHDAALLKGAKKRKVAATWVPWTAPRLGFASGYGAGVTSPGWYEHLFVTDEDVIPSWFVRVARALRDERLDVSTASLVDAARLAQALAALRGRPTPGLAEVNDATVAALGEGSAVPLQIVASKLIVGDALGAVPESTPMVPLAADLARRQRSLRLKPSASETVITLDLRQELHLAKSVFLHRLALLGVPWGVPAETGRTLGTFKEAWQLAWQPELSVALIEASTYGTTIDRAAAAKVTAVAGEATDITALAELVQQCLLADLPDGLISVVAQLETQTAHQHDTATLLGAVEPLARTLRYGSVRGIDVGDIRAVLTAVVIRAAIGLPAACAALDDDAAARHRALIESAQRGIGVLDDPGLTGPWRQALAALASADHVHGSVSGRVNRLLLDAGVLDADEAGARLSRRLSLAADTRDSAAWVDGFLSGEALLLLHDDTLLDTIDDWVSAIGDETFEDLLPLLRRTFSHFSTSERRQLGSHLDGRHPGSARTRVADPADEVDLDRAAAAIRRVAELVGWQVDAPTTVAPATAGEAAP